MSKEVHYQKLRNMYMSAPIQELYPGTQVTIGPNIEDGFFYDFARDEPFSTDDLEKIEKRMAEIVDEARPTRREVWARDDAIAHFKEIGVVKILALRNYLSGTTQLFMPAVQMPVPSWIFPVAI